jgi:hypothetical protein
MPFAVVGISLARGFHLAEVLLPEEPQLKEGRLPGFRQQQTFCQDRPRELRAVCIPITKSRCILGCAAPFLSFDLAIGSATTPAVVSERHSHSSFALEPEVVRGGSPLLSFASSLRSEVSRVVDDLTNTLRLLCLAYACALTTRPRAGPM